MDTLALRDSFMRTMHRAEHYLYYYAGKIFHPHGFEIAKSENASTLKANAINFFNSKYPALHDSAYSSLMYKYPASDFTPKPSYFDALRETLEEFAPYASRLVPCLSQATRTPAYAVGVVALLSVACLFNQNVRNDIAYDLSHAAETVSDASDKFIKYAAHEINTVMPYQGPLPQAHYQILKKA